MKISYTLFLLLLLSNLCTAQILFHQKQDIEVVKNGDLQSMSWVGGLNQPQFSTIDLNNDGLEDLVIFERASYSIYPFLRVNGQYEYAPDYETAFPSNLEGWMLLRDYDCDQKKDLFTHTVSGIRVYRNTSVADEVVTFELAKTTLFTKGFSGQIRLGVSLADIPAISDIDGDGDLDILKPQTVGSGIELHINKSVETFGTCDSLVFERLTQSWGNFEECGCGNYAFNETCKEKNGRVNHVGGRSLLLIDLDQNGSEDLVFGDEECKDLVSFTNRESSVSASFIDFNAQFPIDALSAETKGFTAAFYEDVDFDGQKDLLIAPNSLSDLDDFDKSVFFYKLTESNEGLNIRLEKRGFLQNEMIDVGQNSAPAFFDLDNDGDFDMFIGNEGRYHTNGRRSSISFYENIGDASNPKFEFIHDDFLGLSDLDLEGIRPIFTDMNADNRPELVFTAIENDILKRIWFIQDKNKSGKAEFDISTIESIDFSLRAQSHITFHDVDLDGKVDLMLGNFSGRLDYYRNISTTNTPIFELEESAYAGIDIDPFRTSARPYFADLNGDNKAELIITDRSRLLRVFNGLEQLDEKQFIDDSSDIIQRRLQPNGNLAFVDLMKTGKPVMVAGGLLGGLTYYENLSDGQIANDDASIEFSIFPNPASSLNQKTKISMTKPGTFEVISILGQTLFSSEAIGANEVKEIDLVGLSNGVYLIRAIGVDGSIRVKRWLVQY